jgi:hypothetical protein
MQAWPFLKDVDTIPELLPLKLPYTQAGVLAAEAKGI